MVKALFDTCILIDYLNGIQSAKSEIELFKDKAISTIIWMEVMVGDDKNSHIPIEQWLSQTFTIINIDRPISIKAVEIRKKNRIKLPDAIIYATALVTERLLVTRNTKDFSESDPTVRIPYQI
jgi:predicted nucleic acid-binding protein